MNDFLRPYVQGFILSGDLASDVRALLGHNGFNETAIHSARVAGMAVCIARQFGIDPKMAEEAGWLHDVSAIIPPDLRLEAIGALGLNPLPEEEVFPLVAHQRLSARVAEEIFGIGDETVLSAIGCHTTLKQGASALDKVIFVADKASWDQEGVPPYLDQLERGLTVSLDKAALAYLTYLWDRKNTLKVVHSWLEAAYRELVCLESEAKPGSEC